MVGFSVITELNLNLERGKLDGILQSDWVSSIDDSFPGLKK